jgi:exonuclease SbcC
MPLDASVVLVHGANGAGKTTLLSAIELALTGEIQALRDAEAGYVQHLPNVDGGICSVRLELNKGTDGQPATSEFRISEGGLSGTPLLEPAQRRFFAERGFLAQSSLGRLLDLYQNPEGRGESSLVHFVNDLLGLDDLDSLIAGLHAAGDERRIRKVVPEYEGQQTTIRSMKEAVASRERRLADLRSRVRQDFEQLRQALAVEPTGVTMSEADLAALEVQLGPDGSEEDFARYAGQAERLSQLRTALIRLPQLSEVSGNLVARAAASRSLETQWRGGPGKQIVESLEAAASYIGPATQTLAQDPRAALTDCLARVTASIVRDQQLLADDDSRGTRAAELQEELGAVRGDLVALDAELAMLTMNWDGLVRSLAALAPHISGEGCPVCGRDFSEVSDEPLVDHVSRMIAQYSQEATRVRAVAEERSAAQVKVSDLEAALAAAAEHVRGHSTRTEVEARLLALSDLQHRLRGLREAADSGSALILEARTLDAQVRELGNREAAEQEVISRINDEWVLVHGPDATVDQSPDATLTLLQGAIAERVAELDAHIRSRSSLRARVDGLRRLFGEQTELGGQLVADKALLKSGEATLATAKSRMQRARDIAAAAAHTRAAIVATVFNGSLNKTWHDLFIRLAPDEPYVPSFGVPTTDRRLTEVQLETVHRFGAQGGTPGAMLSAGNLNTAALTLFLALHLSVEPKVGVVVLDDPVQSMDEVHVSQFAALLRTLSRQLGRQLVLAVHERSLFEYLRLELSPSASGATLITVELERHDGADTECRSSIVPWEEEVSLLSVADAG